VQELRVFAAEVAAAAPVTGALAGVRVFIIHCKDDLEGAYVESIQRVIAGQVRALVEEADLGCEIVTVEQGTRICMLAFLAPGTGLC
jgi:hypothetical protein